MSNSGKHSQTIGTRAQVWHGTAKKTPGGLTKSDLMKNKAGRIVSRAKHNTAKKEMRLVKYGYGTKKGKFGFVKIGSRKRGSRKRGSRKMKGGYSPLYPADVNADYMIKDVVPQEFTPLDRALVGGKRRKMKGGSPYGNDFSPSHIMSTTIDGSGFDGSGIDGQGITDYGAGSNNVQFAAGQAGGRRRRMRGGAPYGSDFSPADAMSMGISGSGADGSGIDGQGITDYGAGSNNVQFAAGQAGGRRRKMRGGKT